jgi:hypothetical protein
VYLKGFDRYRPGIGYNSCLLMSLLRFELALNHGRECVTVTLIVSLCMWKELIKIYLYWTLPDGSGGYDCYKN